MFDLARWRADLTPDRKAVYFNGQWFTYADLDTRATQLAGHLAQNGIKRGDRVAILAYNHICHLDLICLLYTSPSPRDLSTSRMPSSA